MNKTLRLTKTEYISVMLSLTDERPKDYFKSFRATLTAPNLLTEYSLYIFSIKTIARERFNLGTLCVEVGIFHSVN